MQRCMGIKVTDGQQCTRTENGTVRAECPHLHFCGTHWPTYNRRVAHHLVIRPDENPHHRPGMCMTFSNLTGWCPNPAAPGSLICQHELNRRAAEAAAIEQRNIQDAMVETTVQLYRGQNPVPTWRMVVVDLIENRQDLVPVVRYRVALRYFQIQTFVPGILEVVQRNTRFQFEQYMRWIRDGRVGPEPDTAPPPPPPPPRQGLAAIAHDRQNVHTRPVSEQTNKGLEKLLEKQATHARYLNASSGWFVARWLNMCIDTWPNIVRVGDDMWRWYTTRTCRQTEDRLYKKGLDGLYLTIRDVKDDEMRRELFKRAYEECFESVGMCCDGHISRLCNVLVGFDDAFAPPVPFGEILQNKMSSIAALEVETEEKIRQAVAFFTEFAVPEADRAAWLDAF